MPETAIEDRQPGVGGPGAAATAEGSTPRASRDARTPPPEGRRAAPRDAPHRGRPERIQQAPRQPAEGHASHPGRLRGGPMATLPPDRAARQFEAGPAPSLAGLAPGQAVALGPPPGPES